MTTLDPMIARELEELEALFADDVRALGERPDPAFLVGLEARVDAGFPRPASSRRSLSAWVWSPKAALATGFAALALGVVVVAGGGGADETISPASIPDTAAQSTAKPSAGAQDSAGSSEAFSEPAPEAAVGGGAGRASKSLPSAPVASAPSPAPLLQQDSAARERKVERDVQLGLRTTVDKLEDVVDRVAALTGSVGGYVADSSVSRAANQGSATFQLRIPSARLDEVLGRLGKLAHISSMDQSARDITASFDSATSRLSDVRDQRRALLKALGKATTTEQIESIKAQLRSASSQIAQLKGQLDALRRRTSLSTIDLEITASRKAAAAPADEGGGFPGDAGRHALDVLKVVTEVILVAAAILVPLALLLGLGALAGGPVRRRRRERALRTV